MTKSDWKSKASPSHAEFRLENYPFFLMNRAAARYNDALTQSLSGVKADTARWRVLMILDEQNPSSISEICDLAVMKLSTITRVVKRMEEAGFVTTAPRTSDNRVTDVFMTKDGRAQLKSVKAVAASLFTHATRGLSAADIKSLNSLLTKIADNLSRPSFS